jgi:hypothetical protein
MTSHTVISRTHFRKRLTAGQRWEWNWATENATGHHHRLVGALNGFFAQEGCDDWDTDCVGMQGMPEGYQLEKLDSDHYVMTKRVDPQ